MKKTTLVDQEAAAKAKGRKVSAIIHVFFLGLLIFPFLQAVSPDTSEDIEIVMDFSSGRSAEGTKASKHIAMTPKSTETSQPQKVKSLVTAADEAIVAIEEEIETSTPTVEEVPIWEEEAPVATPEDAETSIEKGKGAGDKGSGDTVNGRASSGNGRGFIEGTGALTRAVIDRGDTKKLAQQNGTLILKICINRRGIVTFAEWDKEGSSIKDSQVARTALDNVLKYRFERDRSAPNKECGRLTYIINVD